MLCKPCRRLLFSEREPAISQEDALPSCTPRPSLLKSQALSPCAARRAVRRKGLPCTVLGDLGAEPWLACSWGLPAPGEEAPGLSSDARSAAHHVWLQALGPGAREAVCHAGHGPRWGGWGWREEEALGTVELGAGPPVAQMQASVGQRDGVRPHGHRTGCVAPRWDPGQVTEPLWAFRSAPVEEATFPPRFRVGIKDGTLECLACRWHFVNGGHGRGRSLRGLGWAPGLSCSVFSPVGGWDLTG